MLFGIRGLISGRSGTYHKHKILSMATNASMLGVTESVRFVKDLPFIKSLVSGIDFQSIAAEAFKLVPFLTELENINAALKERKYATDFAIDQINIRMRSILDTTFKNSENSKKLDDLATVILQNFQTDEKIDNIKIFKNYISPVLYDISYFVLAELQTSFKENKEIDKEKSFETRIIKIINSENFKQFLEKFSTKLQKSIEEFHSSMGFDFTSEYPIQNAEIDDETKQAFIDNWKNKIEIENKSVLKAKLKIPSNYNNEAEYQRQLESIVRSAHIELKKNKKFNFGGETFEHFEVSNIPSKQLLLELKKNFYDKLIELQTTARNPLIYSAAFFASLKIDDFGAEIISKMIKQKTNKDVIIKNTNNLCKSEFEEYLIETNIDSEEELQIENFFVQMCKQIPDFTDYFETKEIFEAAFVSEVSENPNFYLLQNFSCQSLF